MTTIEISVATATEAQIAIAAGVTRLVATDTAKGLLAPLHAADVAAIVKVAKGTAEVSAAGAGLSIDDLAALVDAGAGMLIIPVPTGDAGATTISKSGRALASKVKLVAAFAPEAGPDFDLLPVAAMAGFSGVRLVAAPSALTEAVKIADIARFIASARRAKVDVGLSGRLRVVDVGTLLPLRPDHLGFRAAVSEEEDPAKPLDPARIRAVTAAFAIHAVRASSED